MLNKEQLTVLNVYYNNVKTAKEADSKFNQYIESEIEKTTKALAECSNKDGLSTEDIKESSRLYNLIQELRDLKIIICGRKEMTVDIIDKLKAFRTVTNK